MSGDEDETRNEVTKRGIADINDTSICGIATHTEPINAMKNCNICFLATSLTVTCQVEP